MASKGMSKSELIGYFAEKTQKPRKEVAGFFDMLAETAYKEVKERGEFTIPGLGKLVKKHRAARQGRNPATGATIQIPAKTVVKFRVSKQAKDTVL